MLSLKAHLRSLLDLPPSSRAPSTYDVSVTLKISRPQRSNAICMAREQLNKHAITANQKLLVDSVALRRDAHMNTSELT